MAYGGGKKKKKKAYEIDQLFYSQVEASFLK